MREISFSPFDVPGRVYRRVYRRVFEGSRGGFFSHRVSDGQFQGRIEHCFGRRWRRREGICRCIVSELAVDTVEHRFCFRPKLLSSIRRDEDEDEEPRPLWPWERFAPQTFPALKYKSNYGYEYLINKLVTRFANFTGLKFLTRESNRIGNVFDIFLRFPGTTYYLSLLAKRELVVTISNRPRNVLT